MPVAVHFVNGLQVVECGVGRGDDVAALVEPAILLQLVGLAGGGDELPHAQRARRRIGQRIEGALDHRQQGQFGRHAALFEFRDDVVQVAPAALEDALQQVRPVQVPGLAVGHQRAVQVGHRKPLRMRCHRSSGGVVRSMVGIGGSSSFTSCERSGSGGGTGGGAGPKPGVGGGARSPVSCSACSAWAKALSRSSKAGKERRNRNIGSGDRAGGAGRRRILASAAVVAATGGCFSRGANYPLAQGDEFVPFGLTESPPLVTDDNFTPDREIDSRHEPEPCLKL